MRRNINRKKSKCHRNRERAHICGNKKRKYKKTHETKRQRTK